MDQKKIEIEKIVSTAEAAEALHVTKDVIESYVKSGHLKPIKVLASESLFSKDDVLNLAYEKLVNSMKDISGDYLKFYEEHIRGFSSIQEVQFSCSDDEFLEMMRKIYIVCMEAEKEFE